MNYNRRIIPSSLLIILSFCMIGFMAWQDTTTNQGSSSSSQSISLYVNADEFTVSFTNKSQKKVNINWVNQNIRGEEGTVISDLAPGQTETTQSHPGNWFAAYDEEHTFRVLYVANEPDKTTFVIQEEDVKSNDRAVKIQFKNQASKMVHVNWIHPDTEEESNVIPSLAPGLESPLLDSYTKHRFVVFDEERKIRVEFQVDAGHAYGDLVIFDITDDVIGPPKVIFVNVIDEPVHVSWVNQQKSSDDDAPSSDEQVITSLAPNHRSPPILTRPAHVFVAYNDERTFVTEFIVSKHHGTETFQIEGYDGAARAMAQFVNSSPSTTIHVNYIDDRTKEEHPIVRNLPPNESSEILTAHRGHRFVAFDEERTFRQVFTHEGPLGKIESHQVVVTASASDEL